MPQSDRSQVFVSYSHKDGRYFAEFVKMLRPLQDAGLLDVWEDTRIEAGERWLPEIEAALARTRVAVLLLSPDFLASPFIVHKELPPLLQAAKDDGMQLVPVHLYDSVWEHTALHAFQAAHDAGSPIAGMPKSRRQAAYKAIALKLLKLVQLATPPAESKVAPPVAALAVGAMQQATGGDVMNSTTALQGALAAGPGALALSLTSGAALPDQALVGLATASVDAADTPRRPPASFEMLFDCVGDPGDILPAMFGVQDDSPLAIGGPYLGQREGQPDMRGALFDALLRARGPLVVCARAGLGKTREVAELAHEYLLKGWTVCLARGGPADAAMGALPGLPNDLAGRKLLVIVDNLQARCSADSPGTEPYLVRLEACLDSLRQRAAHNSLRTVLVSRSGPQQFEALGLDSARADWRGMSLFALPEFSTDGLVQMLTRLAGLGGAADAKLDPATAVALVNNSDHKPSTLVVNLRRARYLGKALSLQDWLPSEGDTWRECVVAAQTRHADLGHVFQALGLVEGAELLPRRRTLVALSAMLGAGARAAAAVDALVEFELCGLRGGVLTPRPDDLVQLGLHQTGSGALALEPHWDTLIATLAEPAPLPGWADDLLGLSFSLLRAARAEDAERAASLVLEHAPNALAWRTRALVRLVARRYADVVADLGQLLSLQPDDADALRLRATANNLLGNREAMVHDMDRLLDVQPADTEARILRAVAHMNLGRLAEAEADLDAALDSKGATGWAHFMRGFVRWQRNDMEGADVDFTAALEQGFDIDRVSQQVQVLEHGDTQQMLGTLMNAADAASPPVPVELGPRAAEPALLLGFRAITRMRLGRFAESEADMTAALAGGFAQAYGRMFSAIAGSVLPGFKEARAAMAQGADLVAHADFLVLLRGLVRVEQGHFEAALDDLDTALAQGLGDAEAQFARARALAGLGRANEALAALERCIEQGGAPAATHSLRAALRFDQGRHEEAEQDLTAAIGAGRDDGWVYLLRARARHQLHRFEPALADADAALERAPDLADGYATRGAIRYDLQQHPGADDDLTRAMDLGVAAPGLRMLRGISRYALGRHDEALADLNQCVVLNPNDSNAQLTLAGMQAEHGDWAAAERSCDAALRVGRDDALVYFTRAQARFFLDREAEAVADYDQAQQRGKDDAELYLERGRALFCQGKFERARDDLEAARQQGCAGRDLELLVAHTLQALGETGLAQAAYDAALEAGPDDGPIRALRAELRLDANDREGAAADIEQALKLRPELPTVQRVAGRVALVEAHFAEAQQHFSALLERFPRDVQALTLRGLAHYGAGAMEAALADFDAVMAAEPERLSSVAARTLVRLRLGEPEAARAVLEAARARDPRHAEVLGSSGVLALAAGDFSTAAAQFDAARLADTDDPSSWPAWAALVQFVGGDASAALAAYRAALAGLVPGDRALAANEFHFWTGRLAPPETQRGAALRAQREWGEIVALLGSA